MLPYLSKYKKSGYEQLKQNGNSDILPYGQSHSGYIPHSQLDIYQQELIQLGRKKAQERRVQLALMRANATKMQNRQRQQHLKEEIQQLRSRLQNRQREQSMQQRIMSRMQRLILPLIQQSRIPQKSYYDRPSIRQNRYSRQKKYRSLHNSAISIDKTLPKQATLKKFQSNNHIKDKPSESVNKIQKKPLKKNLLSKFRVAAYVVYFAIYFPKYANNFMEVRLEHFKRKYFVKSFHKIVNERISFQNVSKAMDFDGLNQLLREKLQRNKLSVKTLNPLDSISNRVVSQSSVSSLKSFYKLQNDVLDMDIIRYLIEHIVDKVTQQVKVGTFKSLYDFFGDTCMNHCFIMDYVLIRPQVLPMNFHPTKGYVMLDKKLQEIFVVQAFLNKIIVFHMLVYYQISLAESKNNIKSNSQYKIQQKIQMHIGVCILIMILVVNKAVQNRLQSVKRGNYYDIPVTLRPKLLHEILKLIENNEFIQSSKKHQLLQLIYGYETGLKQVQNSISEFYLFIRDKMQVIIEQISAVLVTESQKHKKKQYNIYKQEVLRMKKLKKFDQSIYRIRSENNVTTKKIQKSHKTIQEIQKKVQKPVQNPVVIEKLIGRSVTSIQDHLGESRMSMKDKYANYNKSPKQSENKSPLPVVFQSLQKDPPQSNKNMLTNHQLQQPIQSEKQKQKKYKKKKDKKQNQQPLEQQQPIENQPILKKKKKKTRIQQKNNTQTPEETLQQQPQTTKTKRKKDKNKQSENQPQNDQKLQTKRSKKDKKSKRDKSQKDPNQLEQKQKQKKEKKKKKKQQQKEKQNQEPQNQEKKEKKKKRKQEKKEKEKENMDPENQEKKEKKKKKKKDKEKV